MSNNTFPRLIGDVGGTNARFAWQAAPGAELSHVQTLPAADHPTLLAAMQAYIASIGQGAPRQGAIGIANPVLGDRVQMTNHHWQFSISEMQAALGLERLVFLNDFTALALSLTALAPDEQRQVGGGVADPLAAIGLIGPGTGLGVSGLFRGPNGLVIPIDGEGGHVTLAAASVFEDQILQAMRERFGHVSAERAVSGQGLENLYVAVCTVRGLPAQPLVASDIGTRALSGEDAACVEALDLFFAFLGSTAGNLALSLGARGGVYIGGGIVPRMGDRIDRSAFRERFEGKGRFQTYLSKIPTLVVQAHISPALIGAAQALERA
jgi:glucokinase